MMVKVLDYNVAVLLTAVILLCISAPPSVDGVVVGVDIAPMNGGIGSVSRAPLKSPNAFTRTYTAQL